MSARRTFLSGRAVERHRLASSSTSSPGDIAMETMERRRGARAVGRSCFSSSALDRRPTTSASGGATMTSLRSVALRRHLGCRDRRRKAAVSDDRRGGSLPVAVWTTGNASVSCAAVRGSGHVTPLAVPSERRFFEVSWGRNRPPAETGLFVARGHREGGVGTLLLSSLSSSLLLLLLSIVATGEWLGGRRGLQMRE